MEAVVVTGKGLKEVNKVPTQLADNPADLMKVKVYKRTKRRAGYICQLQEVL